MELIAKIQSDYLLTDVLMPDMNGIELAIAVSKLLPSTKILLFSGQVGISDILMEGQEQGYEFDLVAKPIHPAKFIEILKTSSELRMTTAPRTIAKREEHGIYGFT